MSTVRRNPSLVLASLLALPAVAAQSHTAQAETKRWSDVTVTATQDDGIAIVSARFDATQVLGPTAVAFFTLDGDRYELQDAFRVAGPTVTRGQALYQVSATYRVPTDKGAVDVTVYHDLSDADWQWSDIGSVGSFVQFEGPEGDYRFFWRIDVDAAGAGNDRVQTFGEVRQGRAQFRTPAAETSLDLAGAPRWFDRIQVQVMDGPDYDELTYLWLASEDADARVYAVRSAPGENEAHPATLVNGESLQEVLRNSAGTPGAGNDVVVWYEAGAYGSAGFLGPQMLVSAATTRKGFLELDRMKRTEFPPESARIDGENATLASGFGKSGYTTTNVYYDQTFSFDFRSSYAELQDMLNQGKSYKAQESPTNWYAHGSIAYQLKGPLGPFVLGIMHDVTGYDTNGIFREGAAALYNPITKAYPCDAAAPNDCGTALLWTMAHEIGHAFNLHHEDWYYDASSTFYENSAIMGYSYDIGTLHWTFGDKNGNPHIAGHPTEYVRPGYGVDFIAEVPVPYPYNTTEEHKANHDPIE